MNNLRGQVALIMESDIGSGMDIAKRLAVEGAVVAIHAQVLEDAKSIASQIQCAGGKTEVYSGDASDQKTVEKIVKSIVEKNGSLHILVNNADTMYSGLIYETSNEIWNDLIKTNLKKPFLATQAAALIMKTQNYGRIVTIVSNKATTISMGLGAYCVSKAAVLHAMKVAALELAEYGITVNCVCPGPTEKEFEKIKNTELSNSLLKGELEKYQVGIPAKRLIRTEEIVEAVMFLVSNKTGAVTGSSFFVDGGQASAQGGA